MCFMLASSRFVRGLCRPCFKTKTVGAYRIRPPWRGKSRLNNGVMLGVGSVFAHVRAYAIRPYTCPIDFGDLLGWVLVPFSLT